MSEGRFAVYVNGPDKVSKSWVPMATSALFLHVGRERKRDLVLQSRNPKVNTDYKYFKNYF